MQGIGSSRFRLRARAPIYPQGDPRRQEIVIMHRRIKGCALAALVLAAGVGVAASLAQEDGRPAFVIVERTATTGPESIQQDYARLARDILPRYGARYLARSQRNALLEGDGAVPCCLAILWFPSVDAVRRWFDSPENQAAAQVRRRGATFRIVAIEGLAPAK
jgi:uncharacterized protein (DUF1330 family)